MHILLIHQAFAAGNEAGGTRHYEMARYLEKRGHSVTIITSPINYLTGKSQDTLAQWRYEEQISDHITVIKTYTYPAFHKSFFHRIISFFSFMFSSFFVGMKVKDIDLIWGTSPPIFQAFTAWSISFLRRKPFLLEIRDLWPAFAIAVGVLKSKLLIWLSESLERFLYKRADRVVVNSPGFVDHVQSHGAKWIEIVPNGVDLHIFEKKEEHTSLRKDYGLQNKFIFVYAGAHGLSNDLYLLLDAAEKLANPNIHFLFVGDGKEKENLIQYAKKRKLSNVTWLPPISKDKISVLFSDVDAGVAILKPIELYKTTYPNKVFDYMAAKLPVLLVIDGVIREVVENAQAGVFARPGDVEDIVNKIEYLAANPQIAVGMGNMGHKYVGNYFNREKISNQLSEILEEMKDYD